MTYSNGMFNPHPMANPLNTRLGPSNFSLNPMAMSFRKAFNSCSKQLPDPAPVEVLDSKSLQPPDTAAPQTLGQTLLAIDQMYAHSMTWRDSDIMKLDLGQSQMNAVDRAYWKHAEQQSKKLEAEMTPERKKQLEDALSMFPQSKLEDVKE